MSNEMSRFKATAHAHMQEAAAAKRKWICDCEACVNIRSLVGMDKMFDVWPLVRDVREAEERIEQLPDGVEKQGMVELYHNLSDQLAKEVAK